MYYVDLYIYGVSVSTATSWEWASPWRVIRRRSSRPFRHSGITKPHPLCPSDGFTWRDAPRSANHSSGNTMSEKLFVSIHPSLANLQLTDRWHHHWCRSQSGMDWPDRCYGNVSTIYMTCCYGTVWTTYMTCCYGYTSELCLWVIPWKHLNCIYRLVAMDTSKLYLWLVARTTYEPYI